MNFSNAFFNKQQIQSTNNTSNNSTCNPFGYSQNINMNTNDTNTNKVCFPLFKQNNAILPKYNPFAINKDSQNLNKKKNDLIGIEQNNNNNSSAMNEFNLENSQDNYTPIFNNRKDLQISNENIKTNLKEQFEHSFTNIKDQSTILTTPKNNKSIIKDLAEKHKKTKLREHTPIISVTPVYNHDYIIQNNIPPLNYNFNVNNKNISNEEIYENMMSYTKLITQTFIETVIQDVQYSEYQDFEDNCMFNRSKFYTSNIDNVVEIIIRFKLLRFFHYYNENLFDYSKVNLSFKNELFDLSLNPLMYLKINSRTNSNNSDYIVTEDLVELLPQGIDKLRNIIKNFNYSSGYLSYININKANNSTSTSNNNEELHVKLSENLNYNMNIVNENKNSRMDISFTYNIQNELKKILADIFYIVAIKDKYSSFNIKNTDVQYTTPQKKHNNNREANYEENLHRNDSKESDRLINSIIDDAFFNTSLGFRFCYVEINN